MMHMDGLYVAAAVFLIVVVTAGLIRRPRRTQKPPDQVEAVSDRSVVWQRKRLLNRGETVVFRAACGVVDDIDPAWHVWPQVSLGEVLGTEGRGEADALAYRFINSKRCDFVVVDGQGLPLAVIEYQGSGHYRGNAVERDLVKRTAVTRAGMRYIEVPSGMTSRPQDLWAHLAGQLRPLAA